MRFKCRVLGALIAIAFTFTFTLTLTLTFARTLYVHLIYMRFKCSITITDD